MDNQEMFQALLEILQQEIHIYRSLVDLLQEEQNGLIQADMEVIEEVAKKKETAYLKVKLLEESRMSLTQKISQAFQLNENQVTLTHLIEIADPACTRDLGRCQAELRELVNTVSNLSKMNARLIGNSLDFLRGSLSLLSNLSGECQMYQQDGRLAAQRNGAKVISQKV